MVNFQILRTLDFSILAHHWGFVFLHTSGDTKERRDAFETLRIDVSAHANAEGHSLYAEMLGNPDLQDEGRHSVAEHKEIDDYFEELSDKAFDDTGWLIRFKTLKERLEHHMEEEENDIFPVAKKGLTEAKALEFLEKFNDGQPAEMDKVA